LCGFSSRVRFDRFRYPALHIVLLFDDGRSRSPAAGDDSVGEADMKPITFENLRWLIGGRRKNKDRNESPFKRSDSFKRISIRRNYLEGRGGAAGGCPKGRNPTKRPPPRDADPRPAIEIDVAKTTTNRSADGPVAVPVIVVSKDDGVGSQPPLAAEEKRRPVTPAPPPQTSAAAPSPPATDIAAPVIDYGEWIRCIRAEEDLNNIKRSCSPPALPARYRYHVHKELDDSSRADSAISLGRIWMDAPMLPPTAPRSLELPGRPAAAVAAADADGLQQRRAHHSLESALKDKRDDRPVPSRRFHRWYPAADKTASRSSVASTCSGKDSGFSLSAPGLSDPPRPPKQLFRKKAPRRSAASAGSEPKTACSPTPVQDQLYQVVVARSPLRQPKLDPMMFVPPEKRRSAQNHLAHHHHHHHHHHRHHRPVKSRPVVEVRDYCVPKDARLQRPDDGDGRPDDDQQDGLYESISKGCGGSRARWQESTDDADTEDDLHHSRAAAAPVQAVAAPKSRVKRKKSARRNIRYVVKPVRRAPSVVVRKPSVASKTKSAWITSTSAPRYSGPTGFRPSKPLALLAITRCSNGFGP